MIDLSGRVALVTGGSRGIGAATALLLAQAGANVAVTYQRRKAEADRVVTAVQKAGQGTRDEGRGESANVRAIAIQADLRAAADNDRAVEATVKAFGRLDAFVANAGIWPPDPVSLLKMSNEQWRETVATNLDSVFYGCRAAARAMEPGSTIVIVSSTAGQRGEAYHADYASTKGAVISFVKSLAVELAPGITVNSLAPGWVDTDMAAPALQGAERAKVEATIPLRRIAAPED